MGDSGGEGFGNQPRRRRTLSEKRRMVELTLRAGVSVAQVARENGVNANQLFGWRRAFEAGKLIEVGSGGTALIPVTIASASESSSEQVAPRASGSIHIEFPGRALITVERGADRTLVGSILESLRP